MEVSKCEVRHDRFGRKYWRIYAPDGRYIQFYEFVGWTEETAKEAFKNRFDYYWNI